MTYPIGDVVKNARKGSVGMWIYLEGFAAYSSVAWMAGNVNTELEAWIGSTGVFLGRVNNISVTQQLTVRTWQHIVLTWDCDTNFMYPYVDGVQGTHGHPTTTTPTLHATSFGVGNGVPVGTDYIHPGYICDFFVTEQVLTADQVRQIYQSALPIVATRNPMSLLLTGAGRGKVEGSAGGIFAQDSAGKPTWSLLNEATVVNGESLGIGDVLLGDNTISPAKANLLWDQSAGKLLFRGGVTMQVEIGTDGKLSAGGGAVVLSTDGVGIIVTDTYSPIREYGFDYGGARIGGIQGTVAGGVNLIHALAWETAGRSSTIYLDARAPTSSYYANIMLATYINGVAQAYLGISSFNNAIELSGSRLGFYDKAAIVRPAHIANPTDLPTCITAINAILAAQENLGLFASS